MAQTQNRQKTFRDLLGRDIKVGDNVLHLWTKVDPMGYAKDGKGAINRKLATVIKQTPKGVGIEWRDSHNKRIIKRGTIKNTTNRLIILDGKRFNLEIDDIVKNVEEAHEKFRKSRNTRIKNLKLELELEREMNNILAKNNKELEESVRALMKGSERFELLDL